MQAINEYIINTNWHRFIFLLFETINLIIFIYAGLKIRYLKNNSLYWRYAILPIISYCICRGLRFGRGIDYNLYYDVYQLIGWDFNSTNHEFLFKCINGFMYQLGLPYQAFILLCSFILIWTLMIAIKDYKKIAILVLLFFLYETRNASIYIRWYLGFCFFFLSYISLTKRKFVLYILTTICSIMIHLGTIILIPFLLFCFKINKPLLSHKFVIFLFILSLTIGSTNLLNQFIPYIEAISIVSERAQGYANRLEDLLVGDWGYVNTLSIFAKCKAFFSYLFPILYSSYIAKQQSIDNYIALNFFYIGIIIFPIFNTIELFDRYSMAFMFFSIFITGYSYYCGLKHYKKLSKIKQILFIIGLVAMVYTVLSEILYQSRYWFNMLFIWDAGNLKCLPTWVFHMYD